MLDDQLRGLVRCPECDRSFVAKPSGPAAAADRPRLGELAVGRALVSREHLELCVEHQRAIKNSPSHPYKRLGEILVDKGLLNPEDVEGLLEAQRGEPRAASREVGASSFELSWLAARGSWLAARSSWLAAWLRPGRRRAALLGAIAALAVAAVLLWPASGAERALAAYLADCGEAARARDRTLAIPNLGLVVRKFRIEDRLPAVRHDFSDELYAHIGRLGEDTWADLLKNTEMTGQKRMALTLVAQRLFKAVTPIEARSLVITVQPIRCFVVFKPRGKRRFEKSHCLFLVAKVKTRRWRSNWKVVAYTRTGERRAAEARSSKLEARGSWLAARLRPPDHRPALSQSTRHGSPTGETLHD